MEIKISIEEAINQIKKLHDDALEKWQTERFVLDNFPEHQANMGAVNAALYQVRTLVESFGTSAIFLEKYIEEGFKYESKESETTTETGESADAGSPAEDIHES